MKEGDEEGGDEGGGDERGGPSNYFIMTLMRWTMPLMGDLDFYTEI